MVAEEADRTGGGMPEPVRHRVLALTSEVLPQVTDLPASLRKVAAFAPRQRARLGGTQIATALESDDFRSRVATQIAVLHPELAQMIRDDAVPETADPVQVACFLWLFRPDAWEASYEKVCHLAQGASTPTDPAQLERTTARLDAAEKRIRELKAQYKEQVQGLKAENATLRRKVADARAAVRATSTESEGATSTAVEMRLLAESALVAAESESRRLRARVEELQTAVAGARRDVRSERDESTLRARILLDTLLDAGQGLRRELALPPVAGAPGDRLETELAQAGTRTPSAAGSLGPSSSTLLEQYLVMPRARLIIDGYNVSKTAWPDSTLEAQRIRLLNALAPVVARTGAETTVVFDAAAQSLRGTVNSPRGVRVLFSPEGVIADDVIRDLVAVEPEGRVVVVVSSDQEIATDVRRAGAKAMSSPALVSLLTR